MEIPALLSQLVENRGTNLILSAGVKPTYQTAGEVVTVGDAELTPELVRKLLGELFEFDSQAGSDFFKHKQCCFAVSLHDVGRFRVSVYMQRNCPAVVISRVETVIPSPAELGLPGFLTDAAVSRSGVIVVAGEAGDGTSTTFASLIKHLSTHKEGHIVTVEEPLQFMHQHQSCVVSQREVGIDAESAEDALRLAVLQSPDVVGISDLISYEALEFAFKLARGGSLVIIVVKALNVSGAIKMMLSMFPESKREQAKLLLSKSLSLVFCQRLLVTMKDSSPVLAYESLFNDGSVESAIRTEERGSWYKRRMEESFLESEGTFDQCIVDLQKSGYITESEATLYADDSEFVSHNI